MAVIFDANDIETTFHANKKDYQFWHQKCLSLDNFLFPVQPNCGWCVNACKGRIADQKNAYSGLKYVYCMQLVKFKYNKRQRCVGIQLKNLLTVGHVGYCTARNCNAVNCNPTPLQQVFIHTVMLKKCHVTLFLGSEIISIFQNAVKNSL